MMGIMMKMMKMMTTTTMVLKESIEVRTDFDNPFFCTILPFNILLKA